MNSVFSIVGLIAFLLCAALAGWILGLARARRELLTVALCPRCKRRASFESAVGAAPCEHCHEAKAPNEAPLPGRGERPLRFILASVLLLLVGTGAVAAAVLMPRPPTGPQAAWAAKSTATLFADALSGVALEREFLGEVDRRRASGENLGAAARTALATAFAARRGLGAAPPLPVATGGYGAQWLAAIALEKPDGGRGTPGASGSDSDAAFVADILDFCFPPVAFEPTKLGRPDGPEIALPRRVRKPDQPVLERVLAITKATLDGQEVRLWSTRRGSKGSSGPVLVSEEESVMLGSLVPPGTHTLVLEIEVRLYSAFDSQRITDAKDQVRAMSEWPSPLASKRVTVEERIETKPAAADAAPR